jgi:hypothetical protein
MTGVRRGHKWSCWLPLPDLILTFPFEGKAFMCALSTPIASMTIVAEAELARVPPQRS